MNGAARAGARLRRPLESCASKRLGRRPSTVRDGSVVILLVFRTSSDTLVSSVPRSGRVGLMPERLVLPSLPTRYWLRTRRFLVHNILHADDTPHAIALGAAVGMFAAIVPVIGLQTALAVALAALLRANKAICVPMVWVSNPLTAIPIFAASVMLGRQFFASSSTEAATATAAALRLPDGSWLSAGFWGDLLDMLLGLGAELWVGSAVLGAILAAGTYPLMRQGRFPPSPDHPPFGWKGKPPPPPRGRRKTAPPA